MIGTDAFQEVDTYGLTIPSPSTTSWCVRPRICSTSSRRPSASPCPIARPGADRRAEGRAEPDGELRRLPDVVVPDAAPPSTSPPSKKAAKMIEAAERPVLYLGGGVIHSGAARWP
jgi:acetolactate synthase-1/2/3 large subunit